MTPATFPEANRTLNRLPTMCPVPVFSDGEVCIPSWSLSWRERLRVLLTGRVWLGVLWGTTQPPVWLSTERPFESPLTATTKSGGGV